MKIILYCLALATFAVGTDAFVFAGVLDKIGADLDVSIATAGWLTTVFSATYALSAPVCGVLSSHVPRNRMIAAAMSVFILGNLVTVVSPSFGWAILGRVIAALGASSITPLAVAIASSLVPESHRGRALSVVVGGLTVSTALGVPFGTQIAEFSTWRMTLWFVIALGVLALIGSLMLLPKLAPSPSSSFAERLSPLRDTRVAVTLLLTTLALAGEHTAYVYVAAILGRGDPRNSGALALLLLIFGLGALLGNALAGKLTDAIGSRSVFMGSIGTMALALLSLPWAAQDVYLSGVVMFVWGVAGWMYLIPQQHRLLSLAQAHGTFTVSLNSSAIYAGISVGAVVGAISLAFMDVRWIGLVAGVIALLTLAIGHLSYSEKNKAQGDA